MMSRRHNTTIVNSSLAHVGNGIFGQPRVRDLSITHHPVYPEPYYLKPLCEELLTKEGNSLRLLFKKQWDIPYVHAWPGSSINVMQYHSCHIYPISDQWAMDIHRNEACLQEREISRGERITFGIPIVLVLTRQYTDR